jgi:hypothetical protein
MKNIHTLPTDKPSRLYKIRLTQNLQLLEKTYLTSSDSLVITQNIYITSAEDIKENDYIITLNKKVIQVSHILSEDVANGKKIIRTTDQDLIEDGVQSIDDEFLEWFVKNPSCESVEVKCYSKFNDGDFTDYKIIIPKEEPKQETLEEVKPPIGKFIIDNAVSIQGTDGAYYHYSEVCKLLRLQQEQDKNKYSEEDIINALHSLELKDNKNYSKIYNGMKEWFEKNLKTNKI